MNFKKEESVGISAELGDESTYAIRFPESKDLLDQDEEWCEVYLSGEWRRFRFHDYDEIYKVPALYERLFYTTLQCCSPRVVVDMLNEVVRDIEQDPGQLRVLDVGAGNGIVAQCLREIGASQVVGVDLIPEAAMAAERDRPSVYDDYIVADLTDLTDEQQNTLDQVPFNALTCVAALGYGDIPTAAFTTAFKSLTVGSWLAFNVKDVFLTPGEDQSGFARMIHDLFEAGILEMHAYRRYCHRLSAAGERLYYVAIVARKLAELPDKSPEVKVNRAGFAPITPPTA